jgi:uncharacterized protein (TIGR02569 family)
VDVLPGLLPGPDVLKAFGLSGAPVPLAGGQGRSVLVGGAVLKPADDDPRIADWLAETMLSLTDANGFRVSRPLRAASGAWTHGGWTASVHEPGSEPDPRAAPRWMEIIAAGRAFHRALASAARPDHLARRTDWWETGNKVAWQEQQPNLVPGFEKSYDQLGSLLATPPADASQLIHGDLTGNVLFAPGLSPLVIDLSAYWRPVAFGEAVVVGDALIWHGAGRGLLEEAAADSGSGFVQYVARAVVFRLVTVCEVVRGQGAEGSARRADEPGRFERAAALLAGFARAA